jgi:hypothetical protein
MQVGLGLVRMYRAPDHVVAREASISFAAVAHARMVPLFVAVGT